MKILICMDDTDNLESIGTGHLVQFFTERIHELNFGTCSSISRHQLFIHEQIPYTSHNSAMCFEMDTDKQHIKQIIDIGMAFLEKESAAGSDPGLCVAVINDSLDIETLIEFGQSAKKNVLNKYETYHLAEKLGVHLTEHGGTGDGIIGALAGIGLRLSGNDGRFRGWFHFGRYGDKATVGDLCSYDFIDEVRTENGTMLKDNVSLTIGDDKIKIVYRDWKQILIVAENSEYVGGTDWITLTKEQVKRF